MEWVRGKVLGRGSFGTVSLALPRNQRTRPRPLMAVKSCGFSQSSALMNEKMILEELRDCPEVISCFGDGFSFENGEKLYNVLLEYAVGGDLAAKIRDSCDQRLPEMEVRRYTKALLKGIRYIHKLGFVHCDIKLQNILLASNGSLKIADFGLAKRAAEGNTKKGGVFGCELRGTPLYMSPEMVARGEQGTPSDIWALGCVVTEMVTGAPAWRSSDFAGLMIRIGVGEEVPEVPGSLSEQGKDFLCNCFAKDPTKRWTAEMLLNHPFIAGYQDCDNEYTISLIDEEEKYTSISPRCPLEFSGSPTGSEHCSKLDLWSLDYSNHKSWSIAPSERIRELAIGPDPNWCFSNDWITVRRQIWTILENVNTLDLCT